MKRLIVRCSEDIASVNISDDLLSRGVWEDAGSDDMCTYRRRGDSMMMFLPKLHIYENDLDKRACKMGFSPDVVIFPSEHTASSGMPALTVHSIGNYNAADIGGIPETLVHPCPRMVTDALRAIKRDCNIEGFNICFEATHHGPYLETPSFFVEIGSDDRNWGRKDAAKIQADVIEEDTGDNDYITAIGIGGGHYAPRFTELALSYKINFGHILPNYQTEGHDDEDIVRMIRMAAESTGTKVAFLHRKSMKGSDAARITALGESAGCEFIRSKDLEPLSGN